MGEETARTVEALLAARADVPMRRDLRIVLVRGRVLRVDRRGGLGRRSRCARAAPVVRDLEFERALCVSGGDILAVREGVHGRGRGRAGRVVVLVHARVGEREERDRRPPRGAGRDMNERMEARV
jgi:hypothetical protein